MAKQKAMLQPEDSIILGNMAMDKINTFLKIASKINSINFNIETYQNQIIFSVVNEAHINCASMSLIGEINGITDNLPADRNFKYDLSIQDFLKTITFNNKDKQKITLSPNYQKDNNNSFDSINLKVEDKDTMVLKEISLPIFNISNADFITNAKSRIEEFIKNDNMLKISVDLEYFNKTISDLDYFTGEDLTIKIDKNSIQLLGHDLSNDKTRKIKINWYQNFHYGIVNQPKNIEVFEINTDFNEFKKLVTSAERFDRILLILNKDNPITVVYTTEQEIEEIKKENCLAALMPHRTMKERV